MFLRGISHGGPRQRIHCFLASGVRLRGVICRRERERWLPRGCQRLRKACEGIGGREGPRVVRWSRGGADTVLPLKVIPEVVPAGVALAASGTTEGLLAGVQRDVPLQVAREGEGARTVGAPPAGFARHLLLHGGVLWERDTVNRMVHDSRGGAEQLHEESRCSSNTLCLHLLRMSRIIF